MTTEGRVIPDTELAQLRQEVELLRAERAQFLEQLQQKTREIDGLQHQLQQLLRRLFGRSAEKIDPRQLVLFESLLHQLAPPTPVAEALPESAPAPQTSTNGHGRRRLPADLPRQKVIHDLPENEKPCPCCGKMRHIIGQEISDFDMVFVRNEEKLASFDAQRLLREEALILDMVNGKNSVRDIVRHSKLGSYDVTQVLFRLLRCKLIRRRVAPMVE